MDQTYFDIAKVMQAASDPKRILILDMLSCGERCAMEIQDALSLAQPTISYHMKLLADAGLVSMRNEGKYTFYSLNSLQVHDFI